MAGEEQVLIGPWAGILNSVFPTLELIFVIAIAALVLFIFWRRKPFKKYGVLVLIKHRRGNDYSPEFTDARREKNKDGQIVYKCKNGDEIPAQYFKDLRRMGKKTFGEVWESEAGKFDAAPSPFEEKGTDPPDFSQADVNWLIDQHKNNIRMFEKKNRLMELMPFIVPLVTIIIVVLGLVLYQSQVLGPQMNQIMALQEANTKFVDTINRLLNTTQTTQQIQVIPTGG